MIKFLEWEKSQPNGRSNYSNFARYLGVKVPKLTQWRVVNNLPSLESAHIIAAKLGNEVYPLLGFATPGEVDNFDLFPPELQRAFLEAKVILQDMGSPTESESLAVITSALNKAGYRLISKTDEAEAK